MPRTVQIQLGNAVVDAIVKFVESDIETISALADGKFSFMKDGRLKNVVARSWWGTRRIYKLGLVTLADDEARFAHLRAQMEGYAAVAEALMFDALVYGAKNSKFTGTRWKYKSGDLKDGRPKATATEFDWTQDVFLDARVLGGLNRAFHLRLVLEEEGVINHRLASKLKTLATQRNDIHLPNLVASARLTLRDAEGGFRAVNELCVQLLAWYTPRA